MRPYSVRKEDSKYIQPIINNTPSVQPSPLALLAATCSRIGDTFQEDTTIFTHKNLALGGRGRDDVTTLKSCLDTRPNSLTCIGERTVDIQQNTSPPYPSASHIGSTLSCFKVKHEENYDYNHNSEGLHICPKNIADIRMLETQQRNQFSKSCNRDNIQSSCTHETSNTAFSFNSSSSCEHATMPGQAMIAENSCIFQSSPTGSATPSSCSLDNVTLPSNALSHVPAISPSLQSHVPIGSPSLHYTNMDNYQQRQKQYQSTWQNPHQFDRSSSVPVPEKPPCLAHENFSQTNNSILNYSSESHSRQYRSSSLSHMNNLTEQSYQRTAEQSYQRPTSEQTYRNPVEQSYPRHNTGLNQTHEQFYQTPMNTTSPNYPYSNYSMDVKPDPYTIQQNLRQQQQGCIPSGYENTHPQQAQQMIEQQPQATALQPHMPMTPVHNHPIGMQSTFCPACNPNYIPEMVGPPTMTNDLQSHNLAEYQYQQQQMLFARDNRRPRRIACTCPNCRDGENKTVTTKDGKQRKLHVCHIPGCGKIYGKTSHLRAHLRWHAGERPFACNWLFCNKRFTRSDELQRHRRTHTGDKRFECSVCLKKFMRSDHLSKHMKTHQTQKQNKDKNVTEGSKDSCEKNSMPINEIKTKVDEEKKNS